MSHGHVHAGRDALHDVNIATNGAAVGPPNHINQRN